MYGNIFTGGGSMARKAITTTIEEKLVEQAQHKAIDEKCKMNDIIEKALTEYFAKKEDSV